METVSIAPSPGVLVALAHQDLPWRTILGELIDNALDAGANRIEVRFEKDTFIIDDNGIGMEDLIPIVRLGDHRSHSMTRLGRFGIGAKDSLYALGGSAGKVDVRSVHDGRERSLYVDWATILETGKWDIAKPINIAAPAGRVGTRIVVQPCRKPPHGAKWQELVSEIGYQYSPAIKNGAQITLASPATRGRPVPAPRWRLPKMEFEHRADIDVGNRKARVFAGLVLAGEANPRAGLTYSHEFRVIVSASGKGCGDYSFARVCGFVDLLSGWTLSKNKSSIVTGEEELLSAVEEAIRPVLERAQKAKSLLECKEFETDLSSYLNERIDGADARAKRAKGATVGTKRPTGTGGKHRQAAVEQGGATFRGRGAGGAWRVEFGNLGGDSVGKVSERTVILDLDNPFVADIQGKGNREAGIALMAFLIGDVARSENNSGQRTFRNFQTESLSVATGRILASHPILDGAPVLRAVPGGAK